MATINEQRAQLYNLISDYFQGPITKDGVLIKIGDDAVVIKVTMKRNFDLAAETGVYNTEAERVAAQATQKTKPVHGLPYALDDPKWLDVCRCVRGYYNLPSDEPLLVNGTRTRYLRDYYALLNHCNIPRKWIPDHLWAYIQPHFQEKILEKFGP